MVALASCLLLATAASAVGDAAPEEQVIVRFIKPVTTVGVDTGLPEVDAITRAHGLRGIRPAFRLDWSRNAALKRQYGFERTFVLEFPAGAPVSRIVERLKRAQGVELAEVDVVGRGAQIPPDDTHYPDQWPLENMGQSGGTDDADVDAEGGWPLDTGSASVVIAVLDTGIDSIHPEFAGRIVAGFDFVNNDSDPEADHSHGTLVAGIALANANNAFQVAGVDWAAALLPLKVLDQNNQGFTSHLVDAILFATDNGADVINMSLINYPCSGSLRNALQYARDGGAIAIASAGNNGLGDADVSGPGCIPESISIGATDRADQRASFSATGAALDVVAPGSAVPTVRYRNYTDGFTNFSGTSAAAPVVAGIAGLMRSIDSGLMLEDVRLLLQSNADDGVGPPAEDVPGRDDFFGWGRVNMARTLEAVMPPALRRGDVSPKTLGVTGAAAFSVVYSDVSETPPDFVQLVLSGPESGTFAMTPASSGHPVFVDGSFANGELYEASVVLNSAGVYAYHFEAEVSGAPARHPAAGELAGPAVNLVLAEDVATAESSVDSTIVDGDYTWTHADDFDWEILDEVLSPGSPANRFSTLDHRYTFQVSGGDVVSFNVLASPVAFWPLENDEYDFFYSDDGGSVWNYMLTVDFDSGADHQSFTMPSGTIGEVRVRVEDTDSTPGNDGLDRLAISHMFFRSEAAPTPGEAGMLVVDGYDSGTGELSISWDPACGASDHNIAYGPLANVGGYGFTGQDCAIGTTGTYGTFVPGAGSWFFLVVGTDGAGVEGSYGPDASGTERPEQTTDPLCAFSQDLRFRCDTP